MKFNKKILVLWLIIILFAAVVSTVYFIFLKKPVSQSTNNQIATIQKEASSIGCLGENEIVDYDRISLNPAITQPKESSPMIFVKNKSTGEVIKSFQIENVRDSGYPMEVHKCNIYVNRTFNFDKGKGLPLPNYRSELWQYYYNGEAGKLLLVLFDFGKENDLNINNDYSPIFRISDNEKNISLIRGYLGKDNYALIIKDLKTLEDPLTLPITDIEKRNPDLVDDISLDGWTKDSRYFWARTHSGANVLGFLRIDMQTKTFELFPAPENVLGGDALNIEKGLITVHPGNVWYGIADVTEQEKAERRKQGMGTELYIENLLTKKREFVVKTNEPLYYFKPKWLSDTELQYEMPNGEKKIYKINT